MNTSKWQPACVSPASNDGGPASASNLQNQTAFDFCSPPTPSQVQGKGQGDLFQAPKDSGSPFPEAEIVNPFNSSTGMSFDTRSISLGATEKKLNNEVDLKLHARDHCEADVYSATSMWGNNNNLALICTSVLTAAASLMINEVDVA